MIEANADFILGADDPVVHEYVGKYFARHNEQDLSGFEEAEDEKEGDAATGAAKPEGGGKGKGRGKGEGGGKGKGGRGGGERRNEFAANRPKRNDKGVGGKPEKGGSKSTGSKAAVRPARPHHLSLPPSLLFRTTPGPRSPVPKPSL